MWFVFLWISYSCWWKVKELPSYPKPHCNTRRSSRSSSCLIASTLLKFNLIHARSCVNEENLSQLENSWLRFSLCTFNVRVCVYLCIIHSDSSIELKFVSNQKSYITTILYVVAAHITHHQRFVRIESLCLCQATAYSVENWRIHPHLDKER